MLRRVTDKEGLELGYFPFILLCQHLNVSDIISFLVNLCLPFVLNFLNLLPNFIVFMV